MDVHPTSTAGDGKVRPRTDPVAPYEQKEEMVSCPHCGMWNDRLTRKDPDPLIGGNTLIQVSVATRSPGATADDGSVTVYEKAPPATGCRFCGYNFNMTTYGKVLTNKVILGR